MRKAPVLLIVLLAILGLLSFGCAKKKVSTEVDTGEVQKEETTVVEAEKGAGEIQVAEGEVKGEDISRMGAAPAGPPFSDIYFDFDRYDIKSEYKDTLAKVSAWMLNNGASVLVEGHCDERGTNEYNLALGDRRATAVKKFLAAGGVSSKKIETISLGEEKPVCTDSTESCWSKNRRAHFVVGGGG